ncbi:AAA family ATPase [Streptosporangium canum]|uniref:AAA family ATPase n=1 Tax=Streptosporangium canum TaxID=324952 RepID=UPI00367971DB
MTTQRLTELRVDNFRSLRKVRLPLGPVNVLVGPNGAGKTNVLEVFRLLADVVHVDLPRALDMHGGFDNLVFQGGSRPPKFIQVDVKGWLTQEHNPEEGVEEYRLRVEAEPLARKEEFEFSFPDTGGWREIVVTGGRAMSMDRKADGRVSAQRLPDAVTQTIGIQPLSSGLSTLPRLSDEFGGREVGAIADLLSNFRIFDVNVAGTFLPVAFGGDDPLRDDASNLAAFLLRLRDHYGDIWQRLETDAIEVLPQLEGIDFDYPSGAGRSVVVVLRERGLRSPTQLMNASYGTIRLLGLLAMLHDPHPPALTCVEEIDHGLHPQALEILVERVREASERTQFIIATHSPALADRLRPEELIVCERGDEGESVIPVLSVEQIRDIVRASEGMPLGELWFSGALGGDL